MLRLPLIAFLLLTGCASLPRISVGDTQIIGPKDAGKPATLNQGEARETFTAPAGSTRTLTTAPTGETVETWEFTAPVPVQATRSHLAANTGTVDTSIAKHRIDAQERRWLLWAGIGAIGLGVLLIANPYVRWPLGGALFAGCGALFLFAHQQPQLFAVALVIAGLAVGVIGGGELMERIQKSKTPAA
jgi:hypothetical protein